MHRVAERLTAQFRQDVHAAQSAQWIGAAGDGELRLRLSATAAIGLEADVQYTVKGGEVTRVLRPVQADGAPDPAGPPHRDSFLFSDDYRIELLRSDSPDRLQLLILQDRLPHVIDAVAVADNARGDVGARTIAHVLAIVGKHVELPVAASNSEGDRL
jgi:hypothetical protein